MNRLGRLGLLLPLLLASCTALDGYMPWLKQTKSTSQVLVAKSVEGTIIKAKATDPEFEVDPWAFVLTIRNKTSGPLWVKYKVVFTDKNDDPMDVQYGEVELAVDPPEFRKALVPEAESVKARVTLYLLDGSEASPLPIPTPSAGIGGNIGALLQNLTSRQEGC